MAHAKETEFDWSNQNNLRRRAWRSVREFFGKDEEHPLSSETIALATADAPLSDSVSDQREKSLHRVTERSLISESPSTVWPG